MSMKRFNNRIDWNGRTRQVDALLVNIEAIVKKQNPLKVDQMYNTAANMVEKETKERTRSGIQKSEEVLQREIRKDIEGETDGLKSFLDVLNDGLMKQFSATDRQPPYDNDSERVWWTCILM